ncbi:SUPPRESSOR OF GAMMA RESPONSE 1-like [Lotus japonicus]|uniref:SUPPRESSOR OF GAMMA RESPONSE 1-like n=1 Tax=Lotus japonicus TaxID=34305 RepID=UPI00258EB468|nr:SUPPRESSOR OF GAMMA RESPONSE 1-like [Lotus japonicus]
MARSWIIDFGSFAKKVKNTNLSTVDQIKDCGAYLDCPKCHYRIDNSDVFPEWPGFPAGVKFDPSDVELLEHLAAKHCIGDRVAHMFIHEFIPTLEGDQGICYTHPENLPGARKDGSSVHFFNRTVNAYATGQRKRRKIHHQHGLTHEEHVRWHKTGKTKPVIEDGVHKGFKKIMVLYVSSQKRSKPYKSNWVMHQYHLGSEEEEKDGEYVVSKVFYQPNKHTEKNEENPVAEGSDMASRTDPRTPNPNPPSRPHTDIYVDCDDNFDDSELPLLIQDDECVPQESHAPPSDVKNEDNMGDSAWLAGESQDVSYFDDLDDIVLCQEMLDSSGLFNDSVLNSSTFNGFTGHANEGQLGISIQDTLELDTLLDFDFSVSTNLPF